jgi:hypothetical protein
MTHKPRVGVATPSRIGAWMHNAAPRQRGTTSTVAPAPNRSASGTRTASALNGAAVFVVVVVFMVA